MDAILKNKKSAPEHAGALLKKHKNLTYSRTNLRVMVPSWVRNSTKYTPRG